MCLGVPGKIIELFEENGFRMAQVDFNGVIIKTCVETTPNVKKGDYIIVHAGFAINRLDEKEALETLSMLKEIEKAGNDS